MDKRVLFVGDRGLYLSDYVKAHSPNAVLLDQHNYQHLINSKFQNSNTLYTTLSDLPPDRSIFINIISFMDEIVYLPPDSWKQQTINTRQNFLCNNTQNLTEYLLFLAECKFPDITFTGLPTYNVPNSVPLVDTRKSSSPQLWIAGCSISHGIGVKNNEKYGYLLAKDINLNVSFLTAPGSSIMWQSDQIIRSDVCQNDIVIWGLTEGTRYPHINESGVLHVTPQLYSIKHIAKKLRPIDDEFEHELLVNNILAVERVLNFCQKSKAQLIIFGLFSNILLLNFLKTIPNYYHYPNHYSLKNNISIEYQDLGTDGSHPGPKQHQEYKDFLLNIIKKNILLRPHER